MVLSAAEGAAQIPAAGVARMREKANTAVATSHRAVLQVTAIPQGGVQRQLILPDKQNNPVVLVPIFAKREKFRDGYNKSDRFSVTMLSGFCISSSYSLDAKASRGRTRIFCALKTKPENHSAQTRYLENTT
jgi:hypothetical protein